MSLKSKWKVSKRAQAPPEWPGLSQKLPLEQYETLRLLDQPCCFKITLYESHS